MTIASLPRVLRITDEHDSGEFGAANCPHCGAEGRYIIFFDAADETGAIHHLGAMRGCFKLFPQSKLVATHLRLLQKGRDYAKKGWDLNRTDARILDIIDACGRGEIGEQDAIGQVGDLQASMNEWRKNRNRSR